MSQDLAQFGVIDSLSAIQEDCLAEPVFGVRPFMTPEVGIAGVKRLACRSAHIGMRATPRRSAQRRVAFPRWRRVATLTMLPVWAVRSARSARSPGYSAMLVPTIPVSTEYIVRQFANHPNADRLAVSTGAIQAATGVGPGAAAAWLDKEARGLRFRYGSWRLRPGESEVRRPRLHLWSQRCAIGEFCLDLGRPLLPTSRISQPLSDLR